MNKPLLNGFYEKAKKEMLENLNEKGNYNYLDMTEMLFRLFPYTDESICADVLTENPDFDQELYSGPDFDFDYPETGTQSEIIISNIHAFVQFKLEDYARENGIEINW